MKAAVSWSNKSSIVSFMGEKKHLGIWRYWIGMESVRTHKEVERILGKFYLSKKRNIGYLVTGKVWIMSTLGIHWGTTENKIWDKWLTVRAICLIACCMDSALKVNCLQVQQQSNCIDCGVFATVSAVEVCFGLPPNESCYDII